MEPKKGKKSVGAGWMRCASHIVLLLGLAGCANVGPGSAHPEIIRLDGTTIDTVTLIERIEDLTRAADVQGLTVTIFNMIGSGRLVYEHVTIDRGPVHELGEVVVSLGTLRATGTWDGKPMVDHLAYTMVWVRTDGRLKLLSEHNSRVLNGQ